MRRKSHSPEQIVQALREADAKVAAGSSIEQVCRELGISDGTYYKWPKDYGKMKLDQVRRLKHLEKENVRPREGWCRDAQIMRFCQMKSIFDTMKA